MICEECGENQAVACVTTLINGESLTRHVCKDCLKKYQSGDASSVLAALFSGLLQKQVQKKAETKVCPVCGMDAETWKKTGTLGCAKCYDTFREELTEQIGMHVGRRPPVSSEELARKEKMKQLQAELETAIIIENYEQAIVLRDELRALEAQGGAEKA